MLVGDDVGKLLGTGVSAFVGVDVGEIVGLDVSIPPGVDVGKPVGTGVSKPGFPVGAGVSGATGEDVGGKITDGGCVGGFVGMLALDSCKRRKYASKSWGRNAVAGWVLVFFVPRRK